MEVGIKNDAEQREQTSVAGLRKLWGLQGRETKSRLLLDGCWGACQSSVGVKSCGRRVQRWRADGTAEQRK